VIVDLFCLCVAAETLRAGTRQALPERAISALTSLSEGVIEPVEVW